MRGLLHGLRRIRDAILRDAEDVLLDLVDEFLEAALVAETLLGGGGGDPDEFAQQVELAHLFDEIDGLRRGGNARTHLHEVGHAAHRLELLRGAQLLDQHLDRDGRAPLVELAELLEDDPVGGEVEGLRHQLGFETARDGVAAVEQAAREQILLHLHAVRRRAPGEGGRSGVAATGRGAGGEGRRGDFSHGESARLESETGWSAN